VQRHLRGASYPATKEELVNLPEENDAPEVVVEAFESLQEDEFDGPDDVMEALGEPDGFRVTTGTRLEGRRR
jgi:hypothetical protein